MKNFLLTSLLIIITLVAGAQQAGLNGIWSGALTNDSSTTRKDQSFELALTQYENKVYGYAHTQFIVNDTLYYIMKRVKGTIKDSVCEVKDDEILSYNFRGKLDKGIVTSYFFELNKADSSWQLNGTWKTNKTKKFYAISGQMNLAPAKNRQQAKIMAHLQELDLAKKLPFLAEDDLQKTATAKPTYKKQADKKTTLPKQEVIAAQKPEKAIPAVNTVPALSTKEKINQRSIGSTHTVYFSADSLQLAIYDNGEIDGDTVSVQLNGEVIFDKTCLKSTALRKTIHISSDTDETTLILFAENLGKYPPNTGLLVVYEGDKRTQIHFSADLQQNASVVFKRKPKQ